MGPAMDRRPLLQVLHEEIAVQRQRPAFRGGFGVMRVVVAGRWMLMVLRMGRRGERRHQHRGEETSRGEQDSKDNGDETTDERQDLPC